MNMKKILAFALCLVLVAGLSIGGTLAWITANSDQVVNTFTYGDINITLQEHKYDPKDNALTEELVNSADNYKMVPGNTMPKDPFVTVNANSEACWLFVKIDKSSNYGTYLEDYTVANGWTELEFTDGMTPAIGENSAVYYRSVDATGDTASDPIYVLGATDKYPNGYVTVKTDVTKQKFAEIGENKPTLTFKAYAVQKDNVDDAPTAWSYVSL